METNVVHDADQTRYRLVRGDEELGYAEYRSAGDTVDDFHHTLIHPAHRGVGHAERLVGAALDDVRERGQQVKTSCWFVDQYIVEHPEYAELRA